MASSRPAPTSSPPRHVGVRRPLAVAAVAAMRKSLSLSLLQKIASDANPREVTDDVYLRVAEALINETGRMKAAVAQVETMAKRMLAEMKA